MERLRLSLHLLVEPSRGSVEKVLERKMLESGDRQILVADDESSDYWTTKSPSGRIEKVRAW